MTFGQEYPSQSHRGDVTELSDRRKKKVQMVENSAGWLGEQVLGDPA